MVMLSGENSSLERPADTNHASGDSKRLLWVWVRYLSKLEADGKRYVRYEVIGENEVAVPTHFFKIVMGLDGAIMEAYILPNEPISSGVSFDSFKTTIEKVERAAGFIFGGKPP